METRFSGRVLFLCIFFPIPKVKVLLGYIPNYSNAKSLACDTGNEHALTCTRETCSCSQTAFQWNQWR